ncbi:hypothetical protein O7635_34500 [Asanoa sp. WMMD1127]|uniref:hypothetical protein n=1 Tax=Asanoa sp. WMMD1127 TaxID=3016107 RepID=UPI0024172989|nr:hypothetical protein [Asanoa sp. WMMD1127]MDG4826984.1 hypothetical protein [Asanoa sp. WMMD1127]
MTWHGVPRRIRLTVAALALVLTYGGIVHIVQLATGGWPPYAWAPPSLALDFTSLTLLDPLAAALLATRRTAGLHLATLVLATDAAANWYATYRLLDPTWPARTAQAAITVLALASLVAAPRVHPWLRRGRIRSRGESTGDFPALHPRRGDESGSGAGRGSVH